MSHNATASVEIPETRYAKTLDGGYIAYKLLGDLSNENEISIIGSIATNIELFFDFEPAARSWLELASFSRLSLHDRRGTGLSDDMGGLPDLETRAADLLAVLDAAGQRRPTLLASADGGMVATLLAATHPDRVAGLVWFFAQARSVKPACGRTVATRTTWIAWPERPSTPGERRPSCARCTRMRR